MRSVGLKVLNNKLSEYVRLAAAGETVLVTDRDRVVAEIVPPRAERSPILADAMLADMVRKGLLTPPTAPGKGPPPGAEADHEAGGAPGGARPGSKRPVTYIDASVLLAHLFAEDRRPQAALWNQTLVASRLLEYEVWTRIHRRKLAESHGDAAEAILSRIALLDLSPPSSPVHCRPIRCRFVRSTPCTWPR